MARRKKMRKRGNGLSSGEALIAFLDKNKHRLSTRGQESIRSLLVHFIRHHDLTGSQWHLAQELRNEIKNTKKRWTEEELDRRILRENPHLPDIGDD